jgi:hypothetical protein
LKNILRFANRRKHFKKTNNAVGFDVPGRVTVSPVCYAGSLLFFCFVSIFQMLERLLADDMLHPAGVLFRRFTVNTGSDQLLCKELMTFIDFFATSWPMSVGWRNPSSPDA